MVVISESLGESIQRGRGRVGEVTWTHKQLINIKERGSYFLILVNHRVCKLQYFQGI